MKVIRQLRFILTKSTGPLSLIVYHSLEVNMLVELIQLRQRNNTYSLTPVYINPQQIVFLSEDLKMKQHLQEGKLNLGLNQNFTSFTRIRMNMSDYVQEIIVVGDPGLIESKIFAKTSKQLLRG